MSLINQALKRAQAAQDQHAAPPPTLQFRPTDTVPRSRHAIGFLIPIGWTLVALLLMFTIWQALQRGGAGSVQARSAQSPNPNSAPVNSKVAAPSTTPATPTPTAVEPPKPLTPEPAAAVVADKADDAPASLPQAPAPAKPPPLRLQGIVWNPAKPSALINGKTVFVGDRMGDMRVLAIDQESATLVGGGQTNLLSLEQ